VAIGPVQLIVLGFPHRDFHGEIVSQLGPLRDSNTVLLIDALAVHRDEGEIKVQHLTEDEAMELSGTVGALNGAGIESARGGRPHAVRGVVAQVTGDRCPGGLGAPGWDEYQAARSHFLALLARQSQRYRAERAGPAREQAGRASAGRSASP
jgi:hypothetical protein